MELQVAGWKEVGQPILLGTWGTEKHQLISGNKKKINPGFQKVLRGKNKISESGQNG